jgi:heme/copper-type cytochrome/quinol oxidase subunit 1
MARRVYTYAPVEHLPALNAIASAGAAVMAIGVLLFVTNVVVSARKHVPAGDDPWGAYTLEWLTTSPPPEHNFTSLPVIRSERPAFDVRNPELLPEGAGAA